MTEKLPASVGLDMPATSGQTELGSVPATSTAEVNTPSSTALDAAPSGVAAPAAVHAVPAAAATPDDKGGAAAAPPNEADYGPVPQAFSEMGLREEVLRAVTEMGFTAPTQVQRRAYRPVMAGRDLIVQARTGSGKTAAFGLPLTNGLIDPSIDCKNGRIQALVLGPTRELALQVATEVGRIAAYSKLTLTAVYGGAPMGKQVDALRAGSHMVAGTPGRVLDHIRRGTLNLDSVRILVLDEADEMLSMGFLEDIIEIIKRCPASRQTMLFSATMPDDVLRLSQRYLKSPLNLALSEGSVSATEIVHAYYMISGMGRMRDLLRVLQVERPDSAVIFCNTREETGGVAEFLRNNGLDAEPISSDLTQAERERVMSRSKRKELKYLVATDVAARGIDISDLSHVINYSFPESAEVYIHRTGRTGRAGKSGVAISLISPHELGNFYYVKLAYKIRPEERTLPTEAELQTLREGQHLDRLLRDFSEKKPTGDARSLLRRVMASEEGERLMALILDQYLARPAGAAVAAAAPQSAAEGVRRERQAPESRSARHGEGGGATDEVDTRRRSSEREGREGRESRDGRERRDFRDRDGREGRERDSRDRGPRRDREGREGREPREAREPREPNGAPTAVAPPVQVQAPAPVAAVPAVPPAAAPAEPPREARRPSRPAAAPTRAPAADDVIQVEDGRDFWEAWVDSRTSTTGESTMPFPEGAEGGDRRGRRRPERPTVQIAPGDVRLYVNLGRRDQVTDDGLQQFLAGRGLPRITIDLHTTHTYLIVPEAQADATIAALTGASYGSRAVICERARR